MRGLLGAFFLLLRRLFLAWWHSRPREPLYWQTVAIHLLFGINVFHRPFLPHLLPSYSQFESVMPWAWWGYGNVGLALALLLLPVGNVFGLAVRFLSATIYFTMGGVFAAASGTTGAVLIYSVLAFSSLFLWQAEFRAWFPKVTVVRRYIQHRRGE